MLTQFISLSANEHVMNSEYVSSVVVTGLLVVFTVLVLLVLFVTFLGSFFKKNNKPMNKIENVKKKQVIPQTKIEKGVSNEVIAVITAAIAAMSSESSNGNTTYAIKSIKQVKPKRLAWSFAGLQENTRPF